MARKKNVPCPGCGELMWTGATRCRQCRSDGSRAARIKPCERCGQPHLIGHDKTRPYRLCRDCQKRREPVGTCAHCGETYDKIDQRSKYCSRSCRSSARAMEPRCPKGNGHAARARHYGVECEAVNPQAVYERDGWRCGICDWPVDQALAYPNPMSASLDHIIPMRYGGGHTYENTQCSHLRCNIIKRDLRV